MESCIRSPLRTSCTTDTLLEFLETNRAPVDPRYICRPDALNEDFEVSGIPRYDVDVFDLNTHDHTTVQRNFVDALKFYAFANHDSIPKLENTWASPPRTCYIKTSSRAECVDLESSLVHLSIFQKLSVISRLCDAVGHLQMIQFPHGNINTRTVFVPPDASGIVLRGFFDAPEERRAFSPGDDLRGLICIVGKLIGHITGAKAVVDALKCGSLMDASREVSAISTRASHALLVSTSGNFGAALDRLLYEIPFTYVSINPRDDDFCSHAVRLVSAYMKLSCAGKAHGLVLFRDEATVSAGIAPARVVVREFMKRISAAGCLHPVGGSDSGLWPVNDARVPDDVFVACGYFMSLAVLLGVMGGCVPARSCMYAMYGLDSYTESVGTGAEECIRQVGERGRQLALMQEGFAPFKQFLDAYNFPAEVVYSEIVAAAARDVRHFVVHKSEYEGMDYADAARIADVLETLTDAALESLWEIVTGKECGSPGSKITFVKSYMDDKVRVSVCASSVFLPRKCCENLVDARIAIQSLVDPGSSERVFNCV